MFGRGSKCPICDASIVPDLDKGWRLTRGASPRAWFPSHCKTKHQDYLSWKRSKNGWSKFLGITTSIAVTLLIGIGFSLAGIPSTIQNGRPGGLLFLLMIPAYFLPGLLIDRWGMRKFRHEWLERGGFPTSPQ